MTGAERVSSREVQRLSVEHGFEQVARLDYADDVIDRPVDYRNSAVRAFLQRGPKLVWS